MNRRSRPTLPIFWLLAAAAILLRAALPAGWMPVAADGGIRVALCTASGPAELTLDASGQWHKQAPSPEKPRDSCAFGLASAQAADLPPPPELSPVQPAVAALPDAEPRDAGRAVLKFLRPPARGPPIRV